MGQRRLAVFGVLAFVLLSLVVLTRPNGSSAAKSAALPPVPRLTSGPSRAVPYDPSLPPQAAKKALKHLAASSTAPKLGKLSNDLSPGRIAQPVPGRLSARSSSFAGRNDVPISAVASHSSGDLLRDLRSIGFVGGAADDTTVTGRLPASEMARAGQFDSLRYMRQQWEISSTGAVVDQGDKAMGSDLARTKYSVTGKGVRIGIVSNSFNCLKTAAADEASGDLPTKVTIVKEGDCGFGTDEGRAMAQIIADIAPDASVKFASADGGPIAMARAIDALVHSGVDVLVDDIAYADEPYFHDGVIAKAVDAAEAHGVTYLSATGNSGHASYEAPFEDAGALPDIPNVHLHDFKPGPEIDPFQHVTIPANDGAVIAFQWTDNFKTQEPTGPAPKSDLDIAAFDETGEVLAASEMDNKKSLEPFEVMLIPNFSDKPLKASIAVARIAGPPPTMMKWTLLLGDAQINDYATSGAAMWGHAQAAGAISVGAANFRETPAYGQKPPLLRSYSSRGGTEILLDAAHDLLPKAIKRQKPEIVAPDGANTTFFGVDLSDDPDKLPNFPGTSAAAPHAAGVVALLKQKTPTAKPADFCNALASTATDMRTTGFDYDSGYGLVNAGAALAWLTAPGKNGPCGATTLVPIALPSPLKPEPAAKEKSVATPAPPSVAPADVAPVAVAPVVVTAPPTPLPPGPHIFLDDEEILAGSPIDVSGWYLARNADYAISLDGERTLGTVRTGSDGTFKSSLVVPDSVGEGRYLVVGTSGGVKYVAARSLKVHGNRPITEVAAADAPSLPVSSSSGFPYLALLPLGLFVAFVIFLRTWRRHPS